MPLPLFTFRMSTNFDTRYFSLDPSPLPNRRNLTRTYTQLLSLGLCRLLRMLYTYFIF